GTFMFDGQLSMSGGSTIGGNVYAPSFSLSNDSQILGQQITSAQPALPFPFDLSAALAYATANNMTNTIPAAYKKAGAIDLGSGEVLTLSTGNYVVKGINMSGGRIIANGHVGLFVQGPITLAGGALLNGVAGDNTENLV